MRLSAELGVTLDRTALERFAALRRLLIDWNTRVNLTRIIEPRDIDLKLFLDGIALIPWIRRQARAAERERPARIVDVGAGAGFPGLPLKIAEPETELTLIEATGKKAAFIEAAIAALELPGVRAIHGRAEDLGHDAALRGTFDIATARAVARLPALLELCQPFCQPGGWGLYPKGREAQVEAGESARARRLLKATLIAVEPAPLPELSGTSVVIVRQNAPAPRQYPRRAGLPAREPL
ncbi:MAG TPA: 16S rRNA (guanine(527)-N(7))-methyltransferase RsmG [Thermomicrobiaceae bacterium]|nr:16S rRNA (guanine(527)-N(7))-methyltransferase RsmG [Thermomicrobiaceae bacterium]